MRRAFNTTFHQGIRSSLTSNSIQNEIFEKNPQQSSSCLDISGNMYFVESRLKSVENVLQSHTDQLTWIGNQVCIVTFCSFCKINNWLCYISTSILKLVYLDSIDYLF